MIKVSQNSIILVGSPATDCAGFGFIRCRQPFLATKAAKQIVVTSDGNANFVNIISVGLEYRKVPHVTPMSEVLLKYAYRGWGRLMGLT